MPNAGTEQRKLAAIMFTDMVGYSALAQRNEALALELLAEQQCLLRTQFPLFNGREVKITGDGFLVEFPNALHATQCAVEIQRAVAARNSTQPIERHIHVRIGIHVGDVVHREADMYGDGVNIAARIEPLAIGGGICLSDTVYAQVRNKVDVRLTKLNSPELKHIDVPMDVYRVVLPWQQSATKTQGPAPTASNSKSIILISSAVLVLLNLVLAIWFLKGPGAPARRPGSNSIPATNPASSTAAKKPANIQSLAVKPLDDFSGDTNNAYLSDGMTEALCAALGNISALRVPGRSSVMRYKGGQKSIQEIARELNVDAIVEGSVQRTTTNMLVTVQLIEAGTDRHLWATNYKRDLSDFFVVQSEVARAIANEVQARLTPEDQARLARALPANRDAIEACLLGKYHLARWSDEGMTNALSHFQKAIQIDPLYAPAHAGLAWAYSGGEGWWLWPPREAVPKQKEAAQRAIELDPMLADSYVAMGYARLNFDWDWLGAERDFKRAIELDPVAVVSYADFLLARGRFEEAIVADKKGVELDPLSPGAHINLAWAYQWSGQFDLALSVLRKAVELDRNYSQAHLWLGLNYHHTGKTAEALAELQTMVKLDPGSPVAQSVLGYVLGGAGRRLEALKVLVDLGQLARTRYVPCVARALVHVGLGQKDAALDWLEKAYDEREAAMAWLNVDLSLASLRNEPRFKALVKKVENGGRDK